MANSMNLAICAFLVVTISFEIGNGHPINPEDVQSLLPEIPKTKNETVAAIVEDAVVQEAVQSIVGDGTLSGLIVKKNTVILPADAPDVILSQNEQILTAPLSHLEDIRKNITETAAATSEKENSEVTAVEEISLAEVIPLGTPNDFAVSEVLIPEKTEPQSLISEDLVVDKGESLISADQLPQISQIKGENKWKVPGIIQSAIKLPEGVFPQKLNLPDVIDDQISEPVIAQVLKLNDSTAAFHGSVIALLPASGTTTAGENRSEDSSKDIAEYGARIPVAVITSEELKHPSVKIERTKNIPELKSVKNMAAVFIDPEDQSLDYEDDENDMVPAEDIIFRPLFRYRQQQNERTRILENRTYQRPYSYNRYRPSSYSDYNSGQKYNRRRHRPRQYNNYY